MENKIIIGFGIAISVLLIAIGGMVYILLTREPLLEESKVEEVVEVEEIVEPPPLEEDVLLEATKLVGERLRVFDVEERQVLILSAIKAELTSSMSVEEKKQVIREVVDTELTAWKDWVIRDTLIELHGEYATDDYLAIDGKTNIGQLKEFVARFEMEVLGIK